MMCDNLKSNTTANKMLAGETFFTARDKDLLVGVGGLNRDPYTKDATQGRVRRLYVAPAYRRHGVARRLMTAIENAARPVFSQLRLRTDTLAAALFYAQLGYSRIDESGDDSQATHAKRL